MIVTWIVIRGIMLITTHRVVMYIMELTVIAVNVGESGYFLFIQISMLKN